MVFAFKVAILLAMLSTVLTMDAGSSSRSEITPEHSVVHQGSYRDARAWIARMRIGGKPSEEQDGVQAWEKRYELAEEPGEEILREWLKAVQKTKWEAGRKPVDAVKAITSSSKVLKINDKMRSFGDMDLNEFVRSKDRDRLASMPIFITRLSDGDVIFLARGVHAPANVVTREDKKNWEQYFGPKSWLILRGRGINPDKLNLRPFRELGLLGTVLRR